MQEKIHDEPFIRLNGELLEAGYLEKWKYYATLSGTPQGGVLSPLLANIYLDKLDKYVEQELMPEYTKGMRRKRNTAYQKLASELYRLRKQGRTEEAKPVRQQMQQLPSLEPEDPDFRRLKYVRYADDFLLGFIVMYNPARFSQEEQRNRARSIHNESYLVILRIIDNIQPKVRGRRDQV